MWELFKRKRSEPTPPDGSPDTIATIAAELEHEYRFKVDHARVGLFLLGVAPGNDAASELRPLFVDWIESDWRRLAEVAEHEIMLSWITHRLTLDALGCPENVLAEMQTKSTLRRKWNRVIGLAAIDLWKKLNDLGVQTTILKGAPLSLVCYGQEDLRDVRDIDLLVSPADAFRAAEILTAAGYRCEIDNEWLKNKRLLQTMRQISLRSLGGALEIDLHWKVANDWVDSGVNAIDVRKNARLLSIFGKSVVWVNAATENRFAETNVMSAHTTEMKAGVDFVRLRSADARQVNALSDKHTPTESDTSNHSPKITVALMQIAIVSHLKQATCASDLFAINRLPDSPPRHLVWSRNLVKIRSLRQSTQLLRCAICPNKIWYKNKKPSKPLGFFP